MNVDENLTTADFPSANVAIPTVPIAPKPTHLYEFNDGDKYGYIAAVSEEEEKRGKAAGDVVLFVYRGHDGETYKIDTVSPSGAVQADYECKRPCAVLKEYTYQGAEYIGFTPNSLIGAAFTDAFNGFLVPSPLPKPSFTPAVNSTYFPTDRQTDQSSSTDTDDADGNRSDSVTSNEQ